MVDEYAFMVKQPSLKRGDWYHDYLEHGFRPDYRPHEKFDLEMRRRAVDHYLSHGKRITATQRALGYPGRKGHMTGRCAGGAMPSLLIARPSTEAEPFDDVEERSLAVDAEFCARLLVLQRTGWVVVFNPGVAAPGDADEGVGHDEQR